MSQSPYDQVIPAASFTAGTALDVGVAVYYQRIIVTNMSATSDVYVSTDGSAVSVAEGGFGGLVMPGAWRMIGNDQPQQPDIETDPQQPGWTVQNKGNDGSVTPNLNLPASGYPTYVSLLFPTGSTPGDVGLEFV